MPANYAEVLKDLDSQIASLEAEVATLKAGRPTIVLLRNRYAPVGGAMETQATSSGGPYALMGPTNAIPLVLKGQAFPLVAGEIADKLKAGGVRTRGQDFNSNVAATLSRLRDHGVVEKIGDGWRLKEVRTAPDESITVSKPASDSLAATLLSAVPNVWQRQ